MLSYSFSVFRLTRTYASHVPRSPRDRKTTKTLEACYPLGKSYLLLLCAVGLSLPLENRTAVLIVVCLAPCPPQASHVLLLVVRVRHPWKLGMWSNGLIFDERASKCLAMGGLRTLMEFPDLGNAEKLRYASILQAALCEPSMRRSSFRAARK